MKTLAILLMLIGAVILLAYCFMFLLGFAMSFDAPGSDKDPKAWGMRFLMFLPILLGVVLLIWSVIMLMRGHPRAAAIIAAIVPAAGIILFSVMFLTSAGSLASYQLQMKKEAEDEKRFPLQKYTREVEGGVDTILVFSSRIVSYRLYDGDETPYSGPLGDLSEDRTTLLFLDRHDNRLTREDLKQFKDENGRVLSEVYVVK